MFERIQRLMVRAHSVLGHQSVLDSALGLQMINQVFGDYLEFGVFRGARVLQAYETATTIAKYVNSRKDPYLQNASAAALDAMRFIGFDSFEGLPKANAIDVAEGQEKWIGEGGFNAALEEVKAQMPKKALAEGKIQFVKGWFNETCTQETKDKLGIKSASVVYIDCDYYESAVPALEFCTDLLVDGSILIFDDWWIFKGRSDRGEQRAFAEWKEKHKINAKEFIPGTAMSFMIQRD